MAKPWEKQFLNSRAWQRCRAGYIANRILIDGGMCEICRENLGYIVHHKIPLTPQNIGDPEISLSWAHLSYECKQCHDKHPGHGLKGQVLAVCFFDLDGNPTGIRPEFEQNRG